MTTALARFTATATRREAGLLAAALNEYSVDDTATRYSVAPALGHIAIGGHAWYLLRWDATDSHVGGLVWARATDENDDSFDTAYGVLIVTDTAEVLAELPPVV